MPFECCQGSLFYTSCDDKEFHNLIVRGKKRNDGRMKSGCRCDEICVGGL